MDQKPYKDQSERLTYLNVLLPILIYLPSIDRSPNACSGNNALKYAILDTATANNFFTKSIDFCSVIVSFGKIPVNYKKKLRN